MCEQHHRNALNPFLNGLKNGLKMIHVNKAKVFPAAITEAYLSSMNPAFVLLRVFLTKDGGNTTLRLLCVTYSEVDLRHLSVIFAGVVLVSARVEG